MKHFGKHSKSEAMQQTTSQPYINYNMQIYNTIEMQRGQVVFSHVSSNCGHKVDKKSS